MEQALTRATLQTRQNSLNLARRQFETGYSSRLELAQSQAEYQAARAQIPQLSHQITEQENALRILVGSNPGSIARGADLHHITPLPLPSVLPSELMRRRPDIVQAERQLIVAAARNQALYNYEKTVRNAFGEVNNSLDSIL